MKSRKQRREDESQKVEGKKGCRGKEGAKRLPCLLAFFFLIAFEK
jgi:hypothetical protein